MRTLAPGLVLALVIGSSSWAADPHADHHHPADPQLKLELNEGKKWKTDAPLRKGMDRIKSLIEADHPPIHQNRFTSEQYQALAARLDGPIAEIFKNCKLPPAADQMLHVVLVEIIEAGKVMKQDEPVAQKRKAAVRIIQALGRYGEYFDHPGWTKVR